MICLSCGHCMLPRKDVVCPSGTDLCSAPSWHCPECFNITFITSNKEFDYWIEMYINTDDEDKDDKFNAYSIGMYISDLD